MYNHATKTTLKAGASTLALLATTLPASFAFAQAPAANAEVEQVVVTGTSIRGAPPVGSNLISLGREEISKQSAPNVSQVLTTIPSLSNAGASGRGGNGNGGPGQSVYIHQIGASAQNSTLVLMDGHRLPVTGTTNSVVDPNNVPGVMLERVEVLAEGASATYGSDAVAGVVNFITRRRFDGVELRGQLTHIKDGGLGKQASLLTGKNWDTGGFVFGYSFSNEQELVATDRPKTNPLGQAARAVDARVTGTGNSNFGNFNCNPATIRINGAGNVYLNAQNATNVANTAANSTCTNWAYGSLLPEEQRHNAMLRVRQDITDRLSMDGDVVYSNRKSSSQITRGALTNVTVFGPGTAVAGQANPFYTNPPGTTGNRQTISYNFDELFGPGARTRNGDEALIGTANLNYNVTDDWQANVLVSAGKSASYSGETTGVVNTGLANLYLNGTTQTGGATTGGISLPGNNFVTALNLPLTTANALDVWNPAATNRTSQTVRNALIEPRNINRATNSSYQARFTVNGTVFELPGGPVKVAFGGELLRTTIDQTVTRTTPIATSASASTLGRFYFERDVKSAFFETNIPVVGEGMEIPLVRKIDVNLAIRHDKYSDVGGTTNPKASIEWEVFEGLRFRGNASRSFVAPPLNLVAPPFGIANFSSATPITNQNINVPVANYPILPTLGIPGCTATSVTCNISTLSGIGGQVGDPNNIEQKGKGWSVGVDFAPTTFLQGFRASATLWDVQFLGGITNPAFNITVNTASIADRVVFLNGCATPEQILAVIGPRPQSQLFPACVNFLFKSNNANYLNFFARGLDLSLAYAVPTDFGRFTFNVDWTEQLKFDQGFAARGVVPSKETRFSVKNTTGLNTTFPNVATQVRGHVGWSQDAAYIDLYANHTGSYTFAEGTALTPIQLNARGYFNGKGGDKVKANTTFDLTAGYKFGEMWGVKESEVSIRIRNLFDKYAPFVNNAAGYDAAVANVLGRTIAVSLRSRF